MRSLGDYLDLTAEQARSEWGRILRRQPRPRQEPFTPVEVILCYALFRVVNPHRYGGRNIDDVPPIVSTLASLFVRPRGSLTNKMLNLEGQRRHAAAHELQFFTEMASDGSRFPPLYHLVLIAARDLGIGADALPDFLALDGVDEFDLLGQEELLGDRTFDAVVAIQAARKRARLLAEEAETVRMAEHAVRLGQHRFAAAVLANYAHSCAFCGFAPRSLPKHKLLVASHIKPWADSDDRERLDPRNGVAACPTHDAAFDTGLITVNGGLRVHRAPPLESSSRVDPGVDRYFGPALKQKLMVPAGAEPPGRSYLSWHSERIYRGTLAG